MTPTPDEPALELPGLVRDRAAEGRKKAAATRARKAAEAVIADIDPIVGVLLDLPLAHLDHEFDYTVPAAMSDAAQPGVRVKVRFGGKDVDGFVVRRGAESSHPGPLTPLRRVVSPERVLTPEIRDLCDRVAVRYAGVGSDVRRFAVPPRHATVEQESPAQPVTFTAPDHLVDLWSSYPPAAAFLGRLRDGQAPRAVWGATPGEDWPRLLAAAAAVTLAGGRGTLICLPDQRDVARVDAALTALLGEGQHVTLSAKPGPAARYRDFLAILRGHRRIVVGTRSAMFAPVQGLGLAVIWDDGDEMHAEPRAPYPHVRDVLMLRSEAEAAGLIVGSFSRTVEASDLVTTGWAHDMSADRATLRARVRVAIAGATDTALERDPFAASARLPKEAFDAIRWGLERGPVLVHTPRSGYALRLACERCRTPARCATCAGPLQLSGALTPPTCKWCATAAPGWTCTECGGRGLRAPVVGERRTAEELGRTFPHVPVVASSGDQIRDTVTAGPRLVVATPGAEPVAADGYAVVVLLDCRLALAFDGLRVGEDALRRWANAIGLVRPGGRALAVGDPAEPALQALVRWDPAGFAQREAADRRTARLPPAARIATLTGAPGAIDDLLTLSRLPASAEVLGPLLGPGGVAPDDEVERMLVRVPRQEGAALAASFREVQRVRSARRLEPVRIHLDPATI